MPTLTNLFRSRIVKQPATTTTTTTTRTATGTTTTTTTAPTSAAADSSTDSSTASVTLSNANAATTQGQRGDDGGGGGGGGGGGSDGKRLCGGSLRGGGGGGSGGSGGSGSDRISVSVVVTKATEPLAGKFIRRLASLRGAWLSRRTGSTPVATTEAVTTAASPPSGEAAIAAAAAMATAAATVRPRRGRRRTSAMSMRDVLCWPHADTTIDEDSGSAAAAAAAAAAAEAAATAAAAAAAAASIKDEAVHPSSSRQRAGAPGSTARQLECLYSVRQMQGGDSGCPSAQPLPQVATEPALQPRDDATKPGSLANSLGLMQHQQHEQHKQPKQLDFLSAEPLMEIEEFMKWQRRRQNVTVETAGETFVTDKMEIATTSIFMPERRCLEAELSRQQQRQLSPPTAATAAASATLPAVGSVTRTLSGRSVCVMSSPHGLLDLSQERTTLTSSEGPAPTSTDGPTSESLLLFADLKPLEGAPSVTNGAARELQQSSKESQDQSESSCLFATLRPASGWNWSCEIGAGVQGGVEKCETA